jgi:hypothetical protein
LAVRTKVRAGAPNRTLLEACVENATKHPLFLSEARFDAVPGLVCERVDPPTTSNRGGVLGDASLDPGAAGVGLPSAVGALAQRELAPEGGSAHFLFELRKDANEPGAAGEALGKLEIRWRGPGGETGRLQTQQIAGPNRAESEVEVRLAPDAPELRATLATPLTLRFEARNRTAAPTNALELVATDDFDLGDPRRSLSLSSGDASRGRGGKGARRGGGRDRDGGGRGAVDPARGDSAGGRGGRGGDVRAAAPGRARAADGGVPGDGDRARRRRVASDRGARREGGRGVERGGRGVARG